MLADFGTVSDALTCATAFQLDLEEKNRDVPDERKVRFRVGINLGEVIVDRDDIYGDGVNIAARLESLAEPGGICVSESVRTAIGKNLPVDYEFMGGRQVKNIAEPLKAYRARLKPGAVLPAPVSVSKGTTRSLHAIAIPVGVVVIIAVAAVLSWHRPWEPMVAPASVERMAFPLPDQPSIAVLPFDNLSGDDEQEYFVDAFTENIITALAKLPKLFVIARNSSFTYKGKAVNVTQVAEELGVQYVLEGSVQRSGDRLRVTAQLINALTGHHAWSEQYDRNMHDLFSVQDEITGQIVTAMEVNLTDGDAARLHRRDTDDPRAYEHLSRAKALVRRFTKDAMIMAREELEQALALDPEYGVALGWLGWTHWHDARHRWSESRSESLDRAKELAARVLALNEETPIGHSLLGGVHILERDYAKALAEYERAASLAPSVADAQAMMGWCLILVGRPSEAPPHLERAMRLSPSYPAWYLSQLAEAYRLTGRLSESIDAFRQAVALRPRSTSTRTGFIAALIADGRSDEARAEAEALLGFKPNFNLEAFAKTVLYADSSVRGQLLAALREAGLPEIPMRP